MGLLDLFRKQGGDTASLMDPENSGKLETENDQSAEDIALVQHVRQKLEETRASANRIAHEGIWMTNIAYILGYDGLMYNTTSRQFQPINRASAYLKKSRIHANKILPTVQNRLARLSQNPPEYDIAPETNDTEDKDAARLSAQVLESLIDKCEIHKKRLFLYMWLQQCGHSYIKVSWDPSLGKPMMGPEGKIVYEGDVRVDVESPFAVFPDPYAKTDDDAQYLIVAKVRQLDYFKAHYPRRGHLVREEPTWLMSAQYEQRINSINTRGPAQGGMSESFKNSAIEMVKYEARSSQYPNGRMIICANGILLDQKELPVGEIPLAKFDDTVIGGKYYSETPVTHARPIQDQYNETLRRRAEWTRRLLAGKYKAPRGSGIAQEGMNDESGEVLYYNVVPHAMGANIEPLPVPQIPEYAYKEEDRLDNIINYIFGISDVSRGILPSASIPAIGAQLLQEQDQTRLSVVTELHERSWSKVYRLMLKHVESLYKVDRKLKMAGKSREYIIREINGLMLRGNTDVRVRRGSTQPNSKTLKRQDIVNTMSLGLLGNPEDPNVANKILPLLEFGESADIWLDYGIDMAQIKRGMDAMEKGEFVEVDDKDNNYLWCQELNRFRKGDKIKTLPPEIQELFRANLADRLNVMMPPSPSNTPMPPLPDIPPPPLGAGGEAMANLPPGTKSTALAEKLSVMDNQKVKPMLRQPPRGK